VIFSHLEWPVFLCNLLQHQQVMMPSVLKSLQILKVVKCNPASTVNEGNN